MGIFKDIVGALKERYGDDVKDMYDDVAEFVDAAEEKVKNKAQEASEAVEFLQEKAAEKVDAIQEAVDEVIKDREDK